MAGVITALEAQKRDQDRVNVYLDGQFVVGLAGFVAARLRIGQWLTDADLDALVAADELERTHAAALTYLSFRPRSEAELRQHLETRGSAAVTVDTVIERLQAVGLVDDEAFARYWVNQRADFRPRGRWVVMQELRHKGVDAAVAEFALDAAYDESAAARSVAQDLVRRLAHLPPELMRRRLIERMVRRGFAYELIQDILAEEPFSNYFYLDEESEEH